MTSNILKRNGTFEALDISKIILVLQEANKFIENKVAEEEIKKIALDIVESNPKSTEDIRKKVESFLIERNFIDLAVSYIRGCYREEIKREKNILDRNIISLVEQTNKDVMNENANKNAKLVSTQRDLMAGELSKDLARRYIFSKEVVEAHDKGALHVHDLDYAIQPLTNCCLVNLEDMFQNGTMISGVKIDKPKSLLTAVTIATQISAQVASSQYGLTKKEAAVSKQC